VEEDRATLADYASTKPGFWFVQGNSMFHSTTAENFESWDKFLDAYYEPIRTALRLIPSVGEARADDVCQSFFLKMYERDILEKRPTITGRFRNWLYIAAKHHAVDEWRKVRRNVERADAFLAIEPVDPRKDGECDVQFDADEFYALSVLHMTVARVRKHLLEEGKSEHWMIFEELVLAPIIPGRVPKTREELLAMFPGQGPVFLDNRVTTVKRVFRRMLPALIPADPTENLTNEKRFDELIEILHASKTNRLWLAFLTSPTPGTDGSPSSSLELAESAAGIEPSGAVVSADVLQDELRILLGFWLEMPLYEYLDDLERVGPAVEGIIRESRHHGPRGERTRAVAPFNLKEIVAATDPRIAAIPPEELTGLLERLKLFSKRVHRAVKLAAQLNAAPVLTRRDNSMPLEIAQVLYNLAGAMALTHCQARIIGLADERYRKNVLWMLNQPWLDTRLRPVFFAVLKQLG
jgi:DNA-directed RNA polymerase specialized sigma24 family protein